MQVLSHESEGKCHFCLGDRQREVLIILDDVFGEEGAGLCSKHLFLLARNRTALNGKKKKDPELPFGVTIPEPKKI